MAGLNLAYGVRGWSMLLRIKSSQLRWIEHLMDASLEVFQASPTGMRPWAGPELAEGIRPENPVWPRNALGSPRRSFRVSLGKEISGFLSSLSLLSHCRDSETRQWISGRRWITHSYTLYNNVKSFFFFFLLLFFTIFSTFTTNTQN